MRDKQIEYWLRKSCWSEEEIQHFIWGLVPKRTRRKENIKKLNNAAEDINRAVTAGELTPLGDPSDADVLYSHRMFSRDKVIKWATPDKYPKFPFKDNLSEINSNLKPPYLNINHDHFSLELKTCVDAWNELFEKEKISKTKGYKNQIFKWINSHDDYKKLSTAAKKRIATIINPDKKKKGGVPPAET
jgi:hypothetical protein